MEKVKEQLTVKERQLMVASASAAAHAANGSPASGLDPSMLTPLVQKGAGYARALSEGIMLGFGGAAATPPAGVRTGEDVG
jgi:hypothetical protein